MKILNQSENPYFDWPTSNYILEIVKNGGP